MKATEKILGEMAGIPVMLKGKVTVSGRSRTGRAYYSLQRRRDGRNDVRYVPAGKVELVRGLVRNYNRFMRLVERYVRAAERNSKF